VVIGQPAAKSAEQPPRAKREPIFHLQDVTVSYGDKAAVRDVTFDIARHEITALIGPSGCG